METSSKDAIAIEVKYWFSVVSYYIKDQEATKSWLLDSKQNRFADSVERENQNS